MIKKKHMMDHKLISKERYERAYFKRKYKIGAKKIAEVMAEVGTISRDEIMIRCVELGLIQSKVWKDQKFLTIPARTKVPEQD